MTIFEQMIREFVRTSGQKMPEWAAPGKRSAPRPNRYISRTVPAKKAKDA